MLRGAKYTWILSDMRLRSRKAEVTRAAVILVSFLLETFHNRGGFLCN